MSELFMLVEERKLSVYCSSRAKEQKRRSISVKIHSMLHGAGCESHVGNIDGTSASATRSK